MSLPIGRIVVSTPSAAVTSYCCRHFEPRTLLRCISYALYLRLSFISHSPPQLFSVWLKALSISIIFHVFTRSIFNELHSSRLQLIMYSNSFQRVSSSIYFSFYIVFTFYFAMTSKMSCPWELRGLRSRTQDGGKFCFTYNLGKDCSDECGFVHSCMKCGYEKCWAQGCFLGSGHGSYGPRFQPYPTSVAESSSSSNAHPSSKDEQLSVLNKKIGELQRHVHKRDIMIRDLAKTVKRMEHTLKHHGFDLNSLEEISSSDIDWDFCVSYRLTNKGVPIGGAKWQLFWPIHAPCSQSIWAPIGRNFLVADWQMT